MIPLVPRGQPPESWGDEGRDPGRSLRSAFRGSLGLGAAMIFSGVIIFGLIVLILAVSH